jgi:hypothetical protein
MIDDQNRLTTFWKSSSKANNKISASGSRGIDPADLLQSAIKNTVPNSGDFIIDKNSFIRGCYHILMVRKVDQDVSDSITARINSDGSIASINVDYCNVDANHPITQVHKQQLDAQVQKYIEQKKKSDTNISEDKILSRSYNRHGNQIVANYSIRYAYPSGDRVVYDAESKTFKISA